MQKSTGWTEMTQAHNEYARRWRIANPEKYGLILRQRREYYAANPAARAQRNAYQRMKKQELKSNAATWVKFALRTARYNVERSKHECTITLDQIHVPKCCPILGVPFVFDKRRHPHGPSLDRVDNSKGYIPGNVCVISNRANRLKNDATIAEVRAILLYMERA